ncbi:MAG: hypothetical protein EOO27_21650 [Comamonadaceae bacterium]|nr:MAG: hypothetical protein EOO27_21650 [Comamonadaceae bacterium]
MENSVGMWIEAESASTERALLYLHVGALQCWGLHSHRRLVARISETLQAAVLLVDYRPLPEHSVSEGIDDVAFMVPMAIHEAGLPAPASIVTISPLTEETTTATTSGQANSSPCALRPSTNIGVA